MFIQGSTIGDAETELFNINILERLSLSKIEGLLIRPLKSGDYDRGFLQLLTQLTEVGNVNREQFLNRFHMMRTTGSYYIIVVEDVSIGKIIASATLVAEQKFIHNCAMRGRLEDVVVNNKYRGKHLGKLVVNIVLQLARYLHCYKLSLDCKDHLIPFYESLGFKREPSNANYLNIRFPNENTTEQSHL
ncbi:PREDICTED: probable glucosamine 6-phosphate N-acetyltransferase [Dufourea novaeangliae]|uniref:Glucosamine 6-phosphate N-acetyltransferase n=1 Tax=Dufourea novaeangliae TaxID=178035 RepID=A0A154P2S9_DUFNO|nr:PREDICTED: probable glucosamine 6-phosphate N-acetyltransferase [Dufourea novaeangliae]KZC06181.1 putative glucosamine 6-phosphate N-acetyltransferase [Dufourea novaeangliae]